MIIKEYNFNGKKYQAEMETEYAGIAKIVTVKVYEIIKLFLRRPIYEEVHYLGDFGSYDSLAKYCIVSAMEHHE